MAFRVWVHPGIGFLSIIIVKFSVRNVPREQHHYTITSGRRRKIIAVVGYRVELW